MINKNSKIYIAGHKGMVGNACWNVLKNNGYENLIGKNSRDLDLRNTENVDKFIKNERPEIIINAAAKVGGIMANNSYPYEFLIQNMQIQNNLISISHKYDINKFIFLGSSCIYPKFSKQPILEDYLLSGNLEETNQWYAIAKISGIKLIEALRIEYQRDYISLMPCNLYGPYDNFDLKSSHVLPAMIRKMHEAKFNDKPKVTFWGTGNPFREFLYVDDLASAVLFSLENKLSQSIYNVGYGSDISIKNLSELVKEIVGYKGRILWDDSKPDGTPKKLMSSERLSKLNWNPSVKLSDGIKKTYNWYTKNYENND